MRMSVYCGRNFFNALYELYGKTGKYVTTYGYILTEELDRRRQKNVMITLLSPFDFLKNALYVFFDFEYHRMAPVKMPDRWLLCTCF